MVSCAVPELVKNEASPPKLAPTPFANVPTLTVRETPESDATPDAFVVADPTLVPLRVKVMDLLETGDPLAVSVAENVVVPPYVPVAEPTARDVVACEVTVTIVLPELPACAPLSLAFGTYVAVIRCEPVPAADGV
jgi:hypothetical protein